MPFDGLWCAGVFYEGHVIHVIEVAGDWTAWIHRPEHDAQAEQVAVVHGPDGQAQALERAMIILEGMARRQSLAA